MDEACKGGKPSLVNFDYAGWTTEANHLGSVTNAPQTYALDGKQHVLVGAGDMLYAFRLN